MKESYEEELATRFGLFAEGPCRQREVLSVRAKGKAGGLSSSDIRNSESVLGKATPVAASGQGATGRRRSPRTCACVEIPNARTGRSHEPLCSLRRTQVGQRTSQRALLTRTLMGRQMTSSSRRHGRTKLRPRRRSSPRKGSHRREVLSNGR